MNKKMMVVGLFLALGLTLCMNAYAADGGCSVMGAIGGFFYNILPWNWSNWMGK